jgi:hypothetical protein
MKTTTRPVSRTVCVTKGGRSSKKLPLCCGEEISGKFNIRNLEGTAGPLDHSLHSTVRGFYSLCADYAAITKGIRR